MNGFGALLTGTAAGLFIETVAVLALPASTDVIVLCPTVLPLAMVVIIPECTLYGVCPLNRLIIPNGLPFVCGCGQYPSSFACAGALLLLLLCTAFDTILFRSLVPMLLLAREI